MQSLANLKLFMSSIKVVGAGCVTALLAGCFANSLQPVDRTPAAMAQIKTIAVLPPLEPEVYVVENSSDGSLHTGALSTLIATGDQRTLVGGNERLTKLVKQYDTEPLAARLAANIAEQLKHLGYEAQVENGTWRATDVYSPIESDKIKSDADAVLVIQPSRVGFRATSVNGQYQPMLAGRFTLLGKDRKEVLYRGYHSCGWDSLLMAANHWRLSSTKWGFDDFDQMISRPQKPAQALGDCASAVAATVAQDLGPEKGR